ncbi:MAG: FtsJ-like methyltransferase family protein [Chloroflexota bacterium]
MPLSILTCSPYFTDLALNELKRQTSDISPLSTLSPDCLLLYTPTSFNKLTRFWRQRLPIYLHHLCPADFSVALKGTPNDLSTLSDIIGHTVDVKHSLTIQPRILEIDNRQPDYTVVDIEERLYREFQISSPVQAIPEGKILSIAISPDGQRWRAYFGVSWPHQNLSPWPGGVRPHSVDMPNRAGYKLLEAFETFQIKLRGDERVLDLGAAPGAWTIALRQYGVQVTAVSPKPMYASLRKDRSIRYRKMTAETYLKQVEGTFDFMTNDMGIAAQDSARLMVNYARYLRSTGLVVMTLKLRQRNRRRLMSHSFRILRKAYKIVYVRQLVSNRKEVTLLLRKRS